MFTSGLRHWCNWQVAWVTLLVLVVGLPTAQAGDFAKNYGTAGASADIAAVATDTSGNVYVTGGFSGATLDIGNFTLTRIGTKDAFVAKLDTSGNPVWAKNYGGAGAYLDPKGIAVDGAGNVYLGGSLSATLTTPALALIGGQDAFALKLDASGATSWAKNFGGTGGAIVYGTGIAADGAGNAYLGGYFETANLTTPALTKLGANDAFVLKLDSAGTVHWSKNFGGAGTAKAFVYGIAADSDGNVYLGGEFYSANLTNPVLTKIGVRDAFAFKLDMSGTTIWARNLGGEGAYVWGRGIGVDGAHSVYLVGALTAANTTTPALTRIGNQDVFAIKFDASGATTWAKNFGGAGANAYANGIAIDGAGSTYLGGYFGTADLITPVLTNISGGGHDAFAIKLDASGVATWARNFGGVGASTISNGIAVDANANVYSGGFFYNANLSTPPLTRIGASDAFLVKSASAPGATTGVASSITQSGATLYGTVTSNGIAVNNIYFDFGPSTGYGSTQSGTPSSLASGAGDTSIAGNVAGLNCNTLYHFRVNAIQAGGTARGSDATFATSACASGPSATTNAASSMSATGATLNGSVTDVGANVTAIQFEYGATTAYGNVVTPSNGATIIATAGAPTTVTPFVAITDLMCGTTYHFRIKASDANATTHGGDQTFVTSACDQHITFGAAPSVAIGGTGTVSATASSGLPVTFTSTTTSVCTISGVTLTGVTAGTCTVAANQAGNANYNPAPQATQSFNIKAELTVTKMGTGGGTVTSSPAGIDCGATCSANFDSGASVSLTATPDSTSTFGGWTGACAGMGACAVSMDAAKSVTATFTRISYTLLVATAGAGSGTVTSNPAGINCGETCAASFAGTTGVTLTATASTGWEFGGWSGACTGTGACVVTMNGAKSVTATFGYPTTTTLASSPNPSANGQLVTFEVNVSGTGGIPWGTVTVNDGANGLCTSVPLVSGHAQCATSVLNAGSHSLTAVYGGDGNSVGSASAVLTQIVNPTGAGDVWWDAFWRKSDGTNAIWQFTGPGPTQFVASFPPGVPTTWDAKYTGDVNGDGVPDVVWFEPSSGQVAIWLMNSPAALGGASFPASVGAGSSWVLSAVGDVNGDGRADLVWRDTSTGQGLVWQMSAAGTVASTLDLGVVPLSYALRGVGDFNGDGIGDLLWFQASDGQVAVWLMVANGTHTAAFPGAVGPGTWLPDRVGDFDGDGKADIFWRDAASGMTVVWYLNGGTIADFDFFVSVPLADWDLGSVGDFDLDGRADGMWYAPGSGNVVRWMMEGRHIAPTIELLPGVGTGWQMFQ